MTAVDAAGQLYSYKFLRRKATLFQPPFLKKKGKIRKENEEDDETGNEGKLMHLNVYEYAVTLQIGSAR